MLVLTEKDLIGAVHYKHRRGRGRRGGGPKKTTNQPPLVIYLLLENCVIC